jgi:hypothetical protein
VLDGVDAIGVAPTSITVANVASRVEKTMKRMLMGVPVRKAGATYITW